MTNVTFKDLNERLNEVNEITGLSLELDMIYRDCIYLNSTKTNTSIALGNCTDIYQIINAILQVSYDFRDLYADITVDMID